MTDGQSIQRGGSWCCCFFFSSRRRHTRWNCDWSSDVCSSDLLEAAVLFGVLLQLLFELPHQRALRGEPLAYGLLLRRARGQLLLHAGEVALGSGALLIRRRALALRLTGTLLALRAFLLRPAAALRRVVEPLGREREIVFETGHVELGVGEAAFHLAAPRFRGVPRLHARFPFALRLGDAIARRGQGFVHLATAHAQGAQRE